MMEDRLRLDGKVAFVTGAGSGIGRAAAELMARQGARVALLSRTRSELAEVEESIEQDGGEALVLEGDVADAKSVQEAVSETTARWGRLDIVFANAGINGVWAPLDLLEPDEFEKTLRINLLGTFHTIKYALPHLKARGGAVVITSSVNGTRMFSNTGATAYACSKAGQVVMMKMLAVELAEYGIRLNAICPGAIETDIGESTEKRAVEEARETVEYPQGKIPLTRGRPGSSEQVAELVLFLVSDASSHISGTEIWIDGAQSLLQG